MHHYVRRCKKMRPLMSPRCGPKIVKQQTVGHLNNRLTQIALANGARVAPVFEAFGGASIPNPLVCVYTWICHSYHDRHPTTRGYEVMASAFEQTAAYAAAGEE
jgi:hypothetical protein